MTQHQRQRFWAKVLKTESCWLWQGSTDKDGYGTYRFVERGKMHKVHRLAWEDSNGEVLSGLCVLHQCDNPPCVRPDHLFIGTQQDNLADMRAKGRQVRGESHGLRKLSNSEVLTIRRLKQEGTPQRKIAALFNVTDSAISNVVNRKKWKHL